MNKISTARKNIRELTAVAVDGKDTAVEVDTDSDGAEMMEDAPQAAPEQVQAVKKLKTALETVCAKLPAADAESPRRRNKPELPQ